MLQVSHHIGRHVYPTQPDRVPQWLRRIWLWF